MMSMRSVSTLVVLYSFLTGCVSFTTNPGGNYLSEDQVIDLMQNPEEWDGRVVRIKIYPYDNGFGGSYIVCFEPCDQEYAESSPFIVITVPHRFRGYRGDRPVIVTARYSSACFYRRPVTCADIRYGQFTELHSDQ